MFYYRLLFGLLLTKLQATQQFWALGKIFASVASYHIVLLYLTAK